MFRTIEDFTNAWKEESAMTLKMFNNIADEHLDQKIYAEGRTMHRLMWHISGCISEFLNHAGIKMNSPQDSAPMPASVEEIIAVYTASSEEAAKAVENAWKDSDLTDKINMYGEEWLKGFVLYVLILHQTHHRGQLTVLMRQAGLKVPGAYGPSKDEWLAYGKQPLE